ncbi:hypothetical protein POM88_019121 [Heracleum sosnowskyi]|uniref:CCHC-type domain-containing protein n=1 Tax=Heracleum sosnowskyi TaxID=360622 RepID=A0AAD8ITU9_9APIA|nr:hypothetical protein POM88_019121 [Heracleum sosnowskyi]
MDSTNDLARAMNNVSLEEEENGGLTIEGEEISSNDQLSFGFDAKLCVVARFLTQGRANFQAMQQTLAALWKPGRGVYIKDLDTNLFLFHFYHEVDVKRVMEGCPWSFNRRALIMVRLKEGENTRSVELNHMELWVQVYDLKAGFRTERVVREVGNYIREFVASCPSNFIGVWRDFLRVRVKVDVNKPLKRRMKVRRTGDAWFWINFKYENVPTFCFICGVLGHSERFCSRLFVVPENEITKPYGDWMRAPFKRQIKLIGAKWLRNGSEGGSRSSGEGRMDGRNQDPQYTPSNQGTFTWERKVDSGNCIKVRLDRALVTPAFFILFKDAKLTNLEVSTSDHSPLWLEPHIAIQCTFKKTFRFENAWLREPMCYHLVEDVWNNYADRSFYDKINQCSEVLSVWGQEVTGSFKKRINHSKKVLKTLKGRRDEEAIIVVREEKKKLSETYAQHEVFWRQRSKQLWLREGDQNNKFFHAATKNRRKANQIISLQDSHGRKKEWGSGLESLMTCYFNQLFATSDVEWESVTNCDKIPEIVSRLGNIAVAFLVIPCLACFKTI